MMMGALGGARASLWPFSSDYVVQPELSWQPIDSMTIVLGRDVLGGGSSTFFGQFRDNDRIRLRISYAF